MQMAEGHAQYLEHGHTNIELDPLRYTQPPGTHWYHAHKHGSTALQVLNGLVGTFRVHGKFDREIKTFFDKQLATRDAGAAHAFVDRLMVVQQLQEKPPGVGGTGRSPAMLVNGMANPIVKIAPGEIQRWRFVGATMQASAHLQLGFPERAGSENPEVRQIAMDGVQFSPENYSCQPFVGDPDCDPEEDKTALDERTSFDLAPGNRVDLLVKAPAESGTYCLMVNPVSTTATESEGEKMRRADRVARADLANCGVDTSGMGPLLTVIIEGDAVPLKLPEQDDFPAMEPYLKDIPEVTAPSLRNTIHYEMVKRGNLAESQFWINQVKFDPDCANETLVIDEAQEWTLRNNSNVGHPFHIHQNPFQLMSEAQTIPLDGGTLDDGGVRDGGFAWAELNYKYPVWRDTLALPTAPSNLAPNSETDPGELSERWGKAVIRYVAKEFTGPFVNHCHILGHEDRGMMHNTQAVCAAETCDGGLCYATTGPVENAANCDSDGFCPSDCITGTPFEATASCRPPPDQTSDWPVKYGYK